MERSEVERTLASLHSEVTATERRLGALHKLVEGYLELFPDLSDTTDTATDSAEELKPDDRPKGQEAVRRVLMASPGKWFTVPYMLEELRRHNWLPDTDEPGNAIRASLTRVVADPAFQKSRGLKTGAVTFAYTPHATGSAATDSAAPADSGDAAEIGQDGLPVPAAEGQDDWGRVVQIT